MICTLSAISGDSLASLAYAARLYSADTMGQPTIPKKELTDKDRESFDALDEKLEEEGNEKLKEKSKKAKSGGKPKSEEPENPLAEDSGDDESGDDELSMDDF